MMLSRIGGHEMRPVALDVLERWQPQTYVVARTSEHNDAWLKFKQRIDFLKALLPNTKLTQRHVMAGDRDGFGTPLTDDQRSSRYSAEQIAGLVFDYAQDGVLLMPDNEAASDKDDPRVFDKVVDVWTALVNLATSQGVALAIGCKSTGTPPESQYKSYAKLLRAMRDAVRSSGVVHWLYLNAYYDPNDSGFWEHHLYRHQREIRAVAAAENLPMPPMQFGEIGIAFNYEALNGFHPRFSDEKFALSLAAISNRVDIPGNLFGQGDGIYDTRWWQFNTDRPAFWDAFLPIVARVPVDTNERLERAYVEACMGAVVLLPDRFDNRWRRATANTTGEFVNLRAVPSAENNAPLRQILRGETVFFIDEVRSGFNNLWVAVMAGNSIGWVYQPNGGITAENVASSVLVQLPTNSTERAALNAVFAALVHATK